MIFTIERDRRIRFCFPDGYRSHTARIPLATVRRLGLRPGRYEIRRSRSRTPISAKVWKGPCERDGCRVCVRDPDSWSWYGGLWVDGDLLPFCEEGVLQALELPLGRRVYYRLTRLGE